MSVYTPNPRKTHARPLDPKRCAEGVWSGDLLVGLVQCSRKGTISRGKYVWCKQHDPEAVQTRREAEAAKREALFAARSKAWEYERLALELMHRKGVTLDDLQKGWVTVTVHRPDR